MHQPKSEVDGKPKDSAQRNFTDPDSRIMESGGAFLQGYNCQAAVDDAAQVITAADVTNQPPDSGNFAPMMEQVSDNCGEPPDAATGDIGYWTSDVEAVCDALGINAYIATERRKHWAAEPEVTKGPPPEHANAQDRMRHKVRTTEGRAIYALRKSTVEPVFGQIKEARGFRRFLLRGLEAVTGEWSLLCMTHNILKLYRSSRKPSVV